MARGRSVSFYEFAAVRFIQSQSTQKQFCRTLQELSIGFLVVLNMFKISPVIRKLK